MNDDRERRRRTFDDVAALYDEVRPGYPEELIDELVELSGIPDGGHILEIGCGTGQATLPLALRGYRILCLEHGENLAALARDNLRGFPDVSVLGITFERWLLEPDAFDLVVAATSFHWLDPGSRCARIAACLKPSGALALCSNVMVSDPGYDAFHEAVQHIYKRFAPHMAAGHLPAPEQLDTAAGEIEASGLFDDVVVRRHPWRETYETSRYIRLLNTHSPHRALDASARQQLHEAIAELVDSRFGGRVTEHRVAVLQLARKR